MEFPESWCDLCDDTLHCIPCILVSPIYPGTILDTTVIALSVLLCRIDYHEECQKDLVQIYDLRIVFDLDCLDIAVTA